MPIYADKKEEIKSTGKFNYFKVAAHKARYEVSSKKKNIKGSMEFELRFVNGNTVINMTMTILSRLQNEDPYSIFESRFCSVEKNDKDGYHYIFHRKDSVPDNNVDDIDGNDESNYAEGGMGFAPRIVSGKAFVPHSKNSGTLYLNCEDCLVTNDDSEDNTPLGEKEFTIPLPTMSLPSNTVFPTQFLQILLKNNSKKLPKTIISLPIFDANSTELIPMVVDAAITEIKPHVSIKNKVIPTNKAWEVTYAFYPIDSLSQTASTQETTQVILPGGIIEHSDYTLPDGTVCVFKLVELELLNG